jgi:hypothetical protein
MKALHVIVLFICCVASLHATPQSADSLTTEDGQKRWVHLFALSETAEKALDSWKDQKGYGGVSSTANYDGLYASLTLKEKKLYLTALAVDAHSKQKGFFRDEVPLAKVFSSKSPIFTDWFTGDLREYYGESEGYTHVKSNVRIFTFKKGVLIKTVEKKTSELK